VLGRSGLLNSVLLSLGVVGAFVVAGSWAKTTLLYHLFVPAGSALTCGGVLLAWWRRIQHLPLLLRATAVLACVAATILVLCGVTLAWPQVFVYEGAGDFEDVGSWQVIVLVGIASTLLFVPLSLLARPSKN